jgi:hypothetical protein
MGNPGLQLGTPHISGLTLNFYGNTNGFRVKIQMEIKNTNGNWKLKIIVNTVRNRFIHMENLCCFRKYYLNE